MRKDATQWVIQNFIGDEVRSLITVLALSMVAYISSASAAQQDYYCLKGNIETQTTTSISQVTGMASHREGYLVISENSNDPELKAKLLGNFSKTKNEADCDSFIKNQVLLSDDSGVLARIHFDFDSHRLSPLAREALDKLSTSLKEEQRQVFVDGHTDSVGSNAYNLDLGLRRAEAVVAHLSAKGLNKEKMVIRSFGKSSPLKPNNTSENRALNRRTEILEKSDDI